MKAAPKIDSTGNTAIAAPTVQTHAKRQRLKPGKCTPMNVAGRMVDFTLKRIAHADLERTTEVWEGNERDQHLLTDTALADILPSIRDNEQENPGKGRELPDGTIEVADGSRRRMCCIKTGRDYFIWVSTDLTNQEMDHLTETGNQYKETSAYEKGARYLRIKEREGFESKTAWAKHLGIDRKTMDRCVKTAMLPECIIQLFPTVNDISARAGEKLFNAKTDRMIEMAETGQIFVHGLDPEQITAALIRHAKPEANPLKTPRTWSDSSLQLKRSDKGMNIKIADDVPAEKLDKIEKMVRKELGIKDGGK